MWFLVLVAAIVAGIYWYWQYRRRRYLNQFAERGLRYVPIPSLLRTLLQDKVRYDLLLHRAIEQHGRIFGFEAGDGAVTVMVAVPELAQQILSKEFTNFVNRW